MRVLRSKPKSGARLAAGELGLDIYKMREKLAAAGLEYFDEFSGLKAHGFNVAGNASAETVSALVLRSRSARASSTRGRRKRSMMQLGWYHKLDRTERRTYWACFAGFGLDAMDTTIYALVIPALIATLGLTKPEAGYLATASLAGAAVGGWIAGILADRIGRVRILQLTILMVASFTFLAAFASGFWPLLVVRFFQGLGYGGEAAVGGVLISEVIAPELRGRVAASVQSSYAVGYAVSVSLLPVITSLFSEEIGWRVFFALGVIPAGLVFFIRRLVPESGVYVDAQGGQDRRPGHRRHSGRSSRACICAGPPPRRSCRPASSAAPTS